MNQIQHYSPVAHNSAHITSSPPAPAIENSFPATADPTLDPGVCLSSVAERQLIIVTFFNIRPKNTTLIMAKQQKIAQHVGGPVMCSRSICALAGNKSCSALCLEEASQSPARHTAEDGAKRPRFEEGCFLLQARLLYPALFSVLLQPRPWLGGALYRQGEKRKCASWGNELSKTAPFNICLKIAIRRFQATAQFTVKCT